jgi:hypothetical protein
MMYQGDIDMTGMRYAEVFKYQYAGMLCQAGARLLYLLPVLLCIR